jgi:phage FluMu protein Com
MLKCTETLEGTKQTLKFGKHHFIKIDCPLCKSVPFLEIQQLALTKSALISDTQLAGKQSLIPLALSLFVSHPEDGSAKLLDLE